MLPGSRSVDAPLGAVTVQRSGGEERVEALVVFAVLVPDAGVGGRGGGFGAALG